MNSATPHFTIVTVTYNCEKLIEKTLQSVLSQQMVDYEYILIDGQSTDSTMQIVDKYRNRITTVVSEPDSGIYDAMNKAVRLAQGKWVLFLNAGDLFCSKTILTTVYQATKSINAEVVYGDIKIWKGKKLTLKKAKEPCNIQRMHFCHQSAFTKRSLLTASPFNLKYKFSADFDFYKKCYYKSTVFVHISHPIAIYDMNGLSNQQRVRGLNENLKIVLHQDKGFKKLLFLVKLLFVINRVRCSNLLKST
ncbi:MAG: glycosyltransferase family 2 protein [Bacteroides sp.]